MVKIMSRDYVSFINLINHCVLRKKVFILYVEDMKQNDVFHSLPRVIIIINSLRNA